MDVKKFTAKDSKTAIQKVRDCFGDDAIILSNKKVKNKIEIIAAKEHKHLDENALQNLKKQIDNNENAFFESNNTQELPEAKTDSLNNSINTNIDDPILEKMHSEILSFKQLLGHQLLSENYKKDPVKAAVFQYGRELSLSDKIIDKIYNKLKMAGLGDDITKIDLIKVYKAMLVELKNSIAISEDKLLNNNKIISFVGTNGVGKTTLVCKFAAHTVLNKNNKNIIILSSDTQKVGAGDGITKLANILEIDSFFVDNKKDLQKIYDLNKNKIILLDTPGFSLNETLDTNRPESFTEFAINLGLNESIVENHLVIPVIYQNKIYKNLINKFGVIDIKSAILTMFDSVTELGGVMSDLILHNMKLSYYSDGIKIPQSLHEISSNHLIETLLFLTNNSYNKIAD